MRKHASAPFKAQIVPEVLRGDTTSAQNAASQGVHPNRIGLWKARARERFPSLVAKDNADRIAEHAAHEKQRRKL